MEFKNRVKELLESYYKTGDRVTFVKSTKPGSEEVVGTKKLGRSWVDVDTEGRKVASDKETKIIREKDPKNEKAKERQIGFLKRTFAENQPASAKLVKFRDYTPDKPMTINDIIEKFKSGEFEYAEANAYITKGTWK